MGMNSPERLGASPGSPVADNISTTEPVAAMAPETAQPARRPANHATAVATIDWIIKRWLLKSPIETGESARTRGQSEAGLSTFEFIRQEIAFIDAKASAVLTHVSVMVATAGI